MAGKQELRASNEGMGGTAFRQLHHADLGECAIHAGYGCWNQLRYFRTHTTSV